MSGLSSNAAVWSTLLEPVEPPAGIPDRPDDPRLNRVTTFWAGKQPVKLRAGQPVLIGFPQDEGIRRNQGRPGAWSAPLEIRRHFYQLAPWDARRNLDLADLKLVDLGNIRITGTLEHSQEALAEVVAWVLKAGAIPLVLGGGHETAYGHYLGYIRAGRPIGIVNLDAHLDVRPCVDGLGHSGSPFWQAMQHPDRPLPAVRYVCLGAQPYRISRTHYEYITRRGGVVRWCQEIKGELRDVFAWACEHMRQNGCPIYVSLDADVVQLADVPGVSAPNPMGLAGAEVALLARAIGAAPSVCSFDLAEINPQLDRDGQSARWAALVLWYFLTGLAVRKITSS